MRQKWKPILQQWSEQGDTKLHFFAEKVLYNCLRSEHDPSLDEPIFILYDGSKNTDVFLFFLTHPSESRISSSSTACRGVSSRPGWSSKRPPISTISRAGPQRISPPTSPIATLLRRFASSPSATTRECGSPRRRTPRSPSRSRPPTSGSAWIPRGSASGP